MYCSTGTQGFFIFCFFCGTPLSSVSWMLLPPDWVTEHREVWGCRLHELIDDNWGGVKFPPDVHKGRHISQSSMMTRHMLGTKAKFKLWWSRAPTGEITYTCFYWWVNPNTQRKLTQALEENAKLHTKGPCYYWKSCSNSRATATIASISCCFILVRQPISICLEPAKVLLQNWFNGFDRLLFYKNKLLVHRI